MVSRDGRWRVEPVDGGLRLYEDVDGELHVRFAATHPKIVEAYLRQHGVFEDLVDEDAEDPDCE
jgi:hypothetical protein